MPIIDCLFHKYKATAVVIKNNITINQGEPDDMIEWVALGNIDFDEMRIYYPHSTTADEVIIPVRNDQVKTLVNITLKTFVQVPTL